MKEKDSIRFNSKLQGKGKQSQYHRFTLHNLANLIIGALENKTGLSFNSQK
jgi:hypothetical protein